MPAQQETLPPITEAETIEIAPLRTHADREAFRALNEEWIARHFTLEPKDRETLGNPDRAILDRGGAIFMVHCGQRIVGCAALIPTADGVYELSKMAVAPELRGRGIGRKLLTYTIAAARQMGARSLYLGSSTKLENAVHLYEAVGFRHVQPEQLPATGYARANVFMEMQL